MRVAGAVLLLIAVSSTAGAEGVGRDQAKVKFEAGSKAYRESRYAEAARLFGEGYELDPLPALKFNEAQSWWHEYDARRQPEAAKRARDCYMVYLATPALVASDRETAQAQLTQLDRMSGATVEKTGGSGGAADPPRRKVWIGIGVAAGAIVVAAVIVALVLTVGRSEAGPMVVARW